MVAFSAEDKLWEFEWSRGVGDILLGIVLLFLFCFSLALQRSLQVSWLVGWLFFFSFLKFQIWIRILQLKLSLAQLSKYTFPASENVLPCSFLVQRRLKYCSHWRCFMIRSNSSSAF